MHTENGLRMQGDEGESRAPETVAPAHTRADVRNSEQGAANRGPAWCPLMAQGGGGSLERRSRGSGYI